MESQIKALVEGVGLLNVPLGHNQQVGVPLYALLNGSANNVCAGVNTDFSIADYQQMAWSSGCNYFLEFLHDRCNVIRLGESSRTLCSPGISKVAQRATKCTRYRLFT